EKRAERNASEQNTRERAPSPSRAVRAAHVRATEGEEDGEEAYSPAPPFPPAAALAPKGQGSGRIDAEEEGGVLSSALGAMEAATPPQGWVRDEGGGVPPPLPTPHAGDGLPVLAVVSAASAERPAEAEP